MRLELAFALLALLSATSGFGNAAANATKTPPPPLSASTPDGSEAAAPTGFLQIRYTTYNGTRRACVNSTKGNRTLADDGLFTFNFVEANSALAFQVPRCLFNTSEARAVLRGLDTTEDRDSYRRRHQRFFVVPLAGAYRLLEVSRHPGPIPRAPFLPTTQDQQPQHGRERQRATQSAPPRPWSAVTVRETHLSLATLHRRHKPHLCAVHGHPALFDLRFNCSRHELRWGGYGISVNLGPDFFILTAGPWPPSPDRTLGLIFGQPRRVDPKAPYNDASFLLRQTARHDLLAVVHSQVRQQHFSYLAETDFLDPVLTVSYYNLTIALRTAQYLATTLVQKRECGRLSRTALEFVFAYAVALMVSDGVTYADEMPITVPLEREAELAALGDFAARCFSADSERTVRSGLTPLPNITLLSQDHRRHLPPVTSAFQELNRLASRLPTGTLFDAVYVLRGEHGTDNLRERDLLLTRLLRSVERYYQASLVGSLTTSARRDLLRLDGAVNRYLNVSTPARRAALLLTVMCSARELMTWAEYLWQRDLRTPDELYSPCMNGLRREYTAESLRNLLVTERRPDAYADPAAALLGRLRADGLRATHEASCLRPNIPRTVITTTNQTFIVSAQHLLRAPAYPVSNTVVGRTLLITVLPRRGICTWDPSHRQVLTIGVLKNLTLTDACELCHTVLVEYDEVDGLTNLIYLGDLENVQFITDPVNRLLAATPRIHYLVLMDNGTVLEVTDIVVHLAPTPYGAIAAGVVLAAISILIAWSVCRGR